MAHETNLFIGSRIDEFGLNPYEFRILCRIARRKRCTESESSIARTTGISRTKTREAIFVLEKMGMISAVRRKGRSPVMELKNPIHWLDRERLIEFRELSKKKKTCTQDEQVTCTQDEQVKSNLCATCTGTCTCGVQHKVINKVHKGSANLEEDKQNAIAPPHDGLNDRAREFYEKWKQIFPSCRLPSENAVHFLTLAETHSYFSPRVKKAFDEAIRLWAIGVNQNGWNPANIKGISDKFNRLFKPAPKPKHQRKSAIQERKRQTEEDIARQNAIDQFRSLNFGGKRNLFKACKAKALAVLNNHYDGKEPRPGFTKRLICEYIVESYNQPELFYGTE